MNKIFIWFFFSYSLCIIDDTNMCLNTDERFNLFLPIEIDKIGEGGFGKVYGNNEFAVKTMQVKDAN